jgi:hypothetical protein
MRDGGADLTGRGISEALSFGSTVVKICLLKPAAQDRERVENPELVEVVERHPDIFKQPL